MGNAENVLKEVERLNYLGYGIREGWLHGTYEIYLKTNENETFVVTINGSDLLIDGCVEAIVKYINLKVIKGIKRDE